MNKSDTTEVTTTTNTQSLPQEVKTTTKSTEALAQGEHPQKIYETKKTIFRSNQVIWYVLGFLEIMLIFRILLKVVGANQSAGFTSLIYAITTPLVIPFNGILGISKTGNSMIEWSTIIAALVYLCIAWGLVYLLELIYPVTPADLETK